MQLVPELAKKIVSEVQRVMTEHIIVVDEEGMIIASTDSNRVGSFHEGATMVIKTSKKLYITMEMSSELQGVQPGINLPIMYENEVIGVIGITGNPIEIEPFAELIKRMTELIIREANYIEKKESETRGLESFFYEWVYNKEIDEEFIHRGEILGISIQHPYICLLFQLDVHIPQETLHQIQSYMSFWFEKQFHSQKEDYLIRWGHGRFVLLKSMKNPISLSQLDFELTRWQQFFERKYQASLSIGVGKTIATKHIYPSYEEAKKALKVAVKSGKIVYYESLLLDIVLEEVTERTKSEFVNRVLANIQHDGDLIETLRTYFAHNLSLKQTAENLPIHINTLHYRLKQIKELTGIDPKSVEGITLFYIALSYLKPTY